MQGFAVSAHLPQKTYKEWCGALTEKNREWIPLHLHTVYSNFDGTIGDSALVKWAEEHGVSAAAVTDHGIMSAVPSFDKAASSSSVKPIFGCELYMDPVMKNPDGARPAHHLIALAMNPKGYHNLMKLLSYGHRENFYRKPRVTIEKVEEFSEGIVFSSACIAGELPSLLLRNDFDGARKFIGNMQKACRGNFFVELMDTGDRDTRQLAMNESLYAIAKDTGTRMTFTCDAHYFPGDETWYPHILAVNKGTTLAEMKAKSEKAASEYDDNDISMYDLSLRSPSAMWERWGNKYGEALAGTLYVAGMAERYTIAPEKYYMPTMEVTGGKPLPQLAREGLADRLSRLAGDRPAPVSSYRERLEYELDMVSKMGFNDYFLMVHEMVDWAKSSGIFVGPGRGSAAGSILAWSLGITSVDPLRHNLFFERFLNPERVSMPDIDVDFEDERRGEVIAHLKERYGDSAVCGIIGYSEAKWKSNLRDAARTLGYGAGDSDVGGMFSAAVKDYLDVEGYDGPTGHLPEAPQLLADEAVRKNKKLAEKHSDLLKIASLAQKFLSLVRHYTRHASGVVIAPPDVTDHCPLYNLKGAGDMVVQYDMDGVETVKLVKMDILGLSNLTLMKDIYYTSRRFDASTPSPDMLYSFLDSSGEDMTALCSKSSPFHEHITKESIENTLSILSEGDTTGIFQLFSPGMRKLLRNIKPKDIDALSALIALYRPGPLASGMTKSYEEICRYGDNASGENPFPEKVERLVSDVTKDSRGLVIYQEQVMKVAQVLGGYSLGEADMLRRAMGKKKADVMAAEKSNFVSKCMAKGLSKKEASHTFDTLAHFAGYGFNKSHSTAYAYVAFATAWYKANREPAFWGAFLDIKNIHERREDMTAYIRECARKWKLNPPTMLNGDVSLTGSEKCRVIRDGREMGDMMSRYDDMKKANDVLWMEPGYWSIFLGATMLGGISGTKMDSLAKIGKHNDYISLVRHLVLDDDGKKINPKTVAQLTLAGVFDRLLRNVTDYVSPEPPVIPSAEKEPGAEPREQGLLFDSAGHGMPGPRKRGRSKSLVKESHSIFELFTGFVPENDIPEGRPPVPVLRSILIYMEEEMENDPKLAGFVHDSLSRLVAKGTDIDERLRKTDRNRFLAWMFVLVSRLRAKTLVSRNPWGEREIDWALIPVARMFRYLACKAFQTEMECFSNPCTRLTVMRSLYRRDALEFSEGLSVPSWVMASEMTGWTMSGYVDELDAFMAGLKNDHFARASGWGKSMGGYGLWFIGYAERLYEKKGRKFLIMSGRWGNSVRNHFISVPSRAHVPQFTQGECVAVRLKTAERGNYGWKAWELCELKILPLMSPEKGEERIIPLNGGSGNGIIRTISDTGAEKLMKAYLKKVYAQTHPGAEGVVTVSAPAEITDVTRLMFRKERLPEFEPETVPESICESVGDISSTAGGIEITEPGL